MKAASAFGMPIQHQSWLRLLQRERLAAEMASVVEWHYPRRRHLLRFWHEERRPQVAALPWWEPTGLCVSAFPSSAVSFTQMLERSLWFSTLALVREVDPSAWRAEPCLAPVPSDFMGFDAEPLPPMSVAPWALFPPRAMFEMTSTTLSTRQGRAMVIAGMTHMPETLIDWAAGEGFDFCVSGRCFLGTHLPPSPIEGAFLQNGLYPQRRTGTFPVFFGRIPWCMGHQTETSVRFSYLSGLDRSVLRSLLELHSAELNTSARALRALIDTAARADCHWESSRATWERNQHKLVEAASRDLRYGGADLVRVKTSSLAIVTCAEVPTPGDWGRPDPGAMSFLRSAAQRPAVDMVGGPLTILRVDDEP